MSKYYTVNVECYAGYRGEEEPRRFAWGEHKLEVIEILDRWLDPEHRYFKVRGNDGGVYMLRHDIGSAGWELGVLIAGPNGNALK